LVDDGSPDNSAEIIKKWQKKYPDNITYVKKENGGQASARNFGVI
jgi:glycosyltransferase involved in cell wall biosynthesis